MSDALLFLHLLSAAALVTGLVAFSAIAMGARVELSSVRIYLALWHIGLVGVFLLGLALAIDIDGYEIWSAWVLIAIALWMAAGGFGDRLPAPTRRPAANRSRERRQGPLDHRRVVVLLLADMIVKPWA